MRLKHVELDVRLYKENHTAQIQRLELLSQGGTQALINEMLSTINVAWLKIGIKNDRWLVE